MKCCQFFAEFWHGFSEFSDGGVPRGDVLFLIGEEGLEDVDEVSGFGDVQVELELIVLIEECVGWRLDDDVFGGVACGEFLVRLYV